jgi:hypothetical protein
MSPAEAGALASASESAATAPDNRKSFLVTERSSPIKVSRDACLMRGRTVFEQEGVVKNRPTRAVAAQLAQKPIAESR